MTADPKSTHVAKQAVRKVPEDRPRVAPYLVVKGAARLIGFLEQVVGAKERYRLAGPGGGVTHAEVEIGGSVVMLADASAEHPAKTAMLHVYVEDVDATYSRALAAGATPVRPPADQFYGDRSGGVQDPFGNQWWFSTHVEDVSPEEISRRAAAMGK
jgi:uncharacterized glyoxalase superfamily protein PhnB